MALIGHVRTADVRMRTLHLPANVTVTAAEKSGDSFGDRVFSKQPLYPGTDMRTGCPAVSL